MRSMPIHTPDQRLRVFVSSTMQELAAERVAVRAAIERLPDRLAAATELDWSAALSVVGKANSLVTIGRGPTLAIARGVLGDQIRRARIAADLPAAQPSATAVSAFYTAYPEGAGKDDLPVWLKGDPVRIVTIIEKIYIN